MKRIFLLSLLILIQSCYSYKTSTSDDYIDLIDKKVKIETKQNKILKGKLTRVENNQLSIERHKKIKIIPISNLSEIKERKFSILKTSFLGFTISLSVLALIVDAIIKSLGKV